jgi:hypothetical protein
MIWIFVVLILVVIAKYYTAISVKNLEARLNEARAGIEEAKGRLKIAKDRQDAAKDEEKALRFRVERLQALIQDYETDIRMPRRTEEESEEKIR